MLTTSISLPAEQAPIWRANQREVMRLAVRTLRLTMFRNGVRRSVTRRYNRHEQPFVVVTTRFTAAEYDTLHCAAAAMRVSVSWLVNRMIQLWLKPARRRAGNTHVTNYDCDSLKWNNQVGVITECLMFWRKNHPKNREPQRITREITDKNIHCT